MKVIIAEVIARVAHRGQTRMGTVEPYINHPRRVAESLKKQPNGVMIYVYDAALLHDVLEDSKFEAQDLLDLGIVEETVDLVVALTRHHGETYNEYVRRVMEHSTEARDIKIADVKDNLTSLAPGHSLRKRYEMTLTKLEGTKLA